MIQQLNKNSLINNNFFEDLKKKLSKYQITPTIHSKSNTKIGKTLDLNVLMQKNK